MGIFDSIKHAFNPEVKDTFDYLHRNYYKGLKSFCESSGIDTYSSGYHILIPRINLFNPSYSDMKRIYESKDAIIKLHELILKREKIEEDKYELKKLQKSYPHAFVYFCNECLGGVIYDSSIKMPGGKKSAQQNLYGSNEYRVSFILPLIALRDEKKCYYDNQYSPIHNNHGRTPLYPDSNKTPYLTEPRTIDDLIYPDIQKILAKRNLFASKEKEILKDLEKEDFVAKKVSANAEKKFATEDTQKIQMERKQRGEEAKRVRLNELKSCVSSWYIPNRSVVRCFSLYFYYPTTCTWDASQEEWNIRNLIWNFKAKPHTFQPENTIKSLHQASCKKVVSLLEKVLNHYFGSKTSLLTLICIPASTGLVTEKRFKDFSEEICLKTGMENGYPYITITKDGISKNDPNNSTGHSIPVEVAFSSVFFRDKYVLLFDDVVTSGATVERFKNLIEKTGATVIGALSIGRTMHERQDFHPINHLL